jgi:hypothetical protein
LVFLDHKQTRGLDPFVRRESGLAFQALPAPTYSLIDIPGVNYLRISEAAVRAVHLPSTQSLLLVL